jgi:hypothetical protein
MASDFVKRLDDLIRQELSILGHDYQGIVAGIEETRAGGGAFVRLQPPYEDFSLEEPEAGVSDSTFAARIRRRLRVAIEAPERSPALEG